MLAPLSWLRDFAPFPADAEVVARGLDALGMVVEGVTRVGAGLEGVVVARVLATRPHPDADRIQLVDVDAGSGEALQVACGAFNFAPGDLVPLATIGAVLPNGLEIGRRKLRGEWSNGMLCAPDELGLGDDHAGILVLPADREVGASFAEAMGIEHDVVYDLDITANRPDAMSMAGVARDLAAWLRVPFALPVSEAPAGGAAAATLTSVVVEAPDLCPRFTARVIQGVRVGSSTEIVQRRLALAGMRPINNVVDASNYVMLELGQPTHPYDRARLPGAGFVVRRARPGETLVTLDGVERSFSSGDDCLICDAEGNPVGIGGIMGGASSEISQETTDVVLEAAFFSPMAISWTSKRLNLRTEASARFERGVDVEGIDGAALRFGELIGAGVPTVDAVDVRAEPSKDRRVSVRVARVNALLGTELTQEDVTETLEPIGFAVASDGDGVVSVTIPSWRPDTSIEVDVIEEVARHFGYARIARTVPSGARTGGLTPYQKDRRRLRDVLVGLGVDEATNPPLIGPGDHERCGIADRAIHAANPMIREESILRLSLMPGLLKALAFNASHRNPDVRFFEIGRVFPPPAAGRELPAEHERLSVALARVDAVAASAAWRAVVEAMRLDGLDLRAATVPELHPARTAAIVRGAEILGYVGEVDPAVVSAHGLEGRVGWIDVDIERLLAGPRRPEEMRPVSRFPSSDIDLAFIVPDAVAAGAVEQVVREAAGGLLAEIRLFDVYRGPGLPDGARSLAYRLRFQAEDRTLTDAEVAEARARCVAAAATLGAALRG